MKEELPARVIIKYCRAVEDHQEALRMRESIVYSTKIVTCLYRPAWQHDDTTTK